MPTASRNVRKWRRLKRELTKAYNMLDYALAQRDIFREAAVKLQVELNKLQTKTTDRGAESGERQDDSGNTVNEVVSD